LSRPLAHLEPHGLPILIGILFILPFLGAQPGVNLDFISWVIARATNAIVRLILLLTANS
jgi:hypothetical protein